jgi:ribulose-5-phosphate 4-epimerase/fuculose-1-phosphate aldolase
MQLATAAAGGTWKPQPLPPGVDGASERMWEHYSRLVLGDTGGRLPAEPEPTPGKPADPDQASAHDVVLANRILADQLGILDEFGHVSLRNPRNPNSYFIAAGAVPASATRDAVIQRDITTAQPDSQGLSIHDEIYKAHPDVNAVLYARTPEIVAFTTGGPPLRPVVNGGAFIGNGLPVVTIANLADPAAGRDVAAAWTRTGAVLLAGRGYVLTSGSIYNLVDRAYQLRQNALIQRQTIALRGKVSLLNERTPDPAPANQPQPPGPTGPTEGRSWIFWSQNASLP